MKDSKSDQGNSNTIAFQLFLFDLSIVYWFSQISSYYEQELVNLF